MKSMKGMKDGMYGAEADRQTAAPGMSRAETRRISRRHVGTKGAEADPGSVQRSGRGRADWGPVCAGPRLDQLCALCDLGGENWIGDGCRRHAPGSKARRHEGAQAGRRNSARRDAGSAEGGGGRDGFGYDAS